MTVWGFPAETKNDDRTLPPGHRRATRRAARAPRPRSAPRTTARRRTDANLVEQPFTDNPSVCTGKPLTVSLDVRTYQDPTQVSHAEDQYPPTTGCESQTFKPVLNAGLTSKEADSPSGTRHHADRRPAAEQVAHAVEHPLG